MTIGSLMGRGLPPVSLHSPTVAGARQRAMAAAPTLPATVVWPSAGWRPTPVPMPAPEPSAARTLPAGGVSLFPSPVPGAGGLPSRTLPGGGVSLFPSGGTSQASRYAPGTLGGWVWGRASSWGGW